MVICLTLLARDIALAVGVYKLRKYSSCDIPNIDLASCLQAETATSRLWAIVLALTLALEYQVSLLIIGIGFANPGRPHKRYSGGPPVGMSLTPSAVSSFAMPAQLSQQEPRVISPSQAISMQDRPDVEAQQVGLPVQDHSSQPAAEQ